MTRRRLQLGAVSGMADVAMSAATLANTASQAASSANRAITATAQAVRNARRAFTGGTGRNGGMGSNWRLTTTRSANEPRPSSDLGVARLIKSTNQGWKGTNSLRGPKSAAAGLGPFTGTNSTSRGLGRVPQIVTKDEYIGDVKSHNPFKTGRYPINPGQSVTFPWLSTVAGQYEKYRFRKLQFYYKPLVSGFATPGQSGKVIFSAYYNALDAPASNKIQMEDADQVSDGLPCSEFALNVDCSRLADTENWHYVRHSGITVSSDLRDYDAANFDVAVVGTTGPDDVPIGELRVRYSVELLNPYLQQLVATPPCYCIATYNLESCTLPSGTEIVLGPWTTTGGIIPINLNVTSFTAQQGLNLFALWSFQLNCPTTNNYRTVNYSVWLQFGSSLGQLTLSADAGGIYGQNAITSHHFLPLQGGDAFIMQAVQNHEDDDDATIGGQLTLISF